MKNPYEEMTILKVALDEDLSWAKRMKNTVNRVVSLSSNSLYWWSNNGDASSSSVHHETPETLQPYINMAIKKRMPEILDESIEARTKDAKRKMIEQQGEIEKMLESVKELTKGIDA